MHMYKPDLFSFIDVGMREVNPLTVRVSIGPRSTLFLPFQRSIEAILINHAKQKGAFPRVGKTIHIRGAVKGGSLFIF